MWSVEDDEIEMPPNFPLKVAPQAYVAALERCWLAIGFPDRKRCLIGVDALRRAGEPNTFVDWLWIGLEACPLLQLC